MSIATATIEHRLREQALNAISMSPEMQFRYREECRARRTWNVLPWISMAYWVFIPTFTLGTLLDLFHEYAFLGLHSVVNLLFAFGIVVFIRARLVASPPLAVLSHLPVSDQYIAGTASRAPWLASLLAIYANLWFYGIIAWHQPQAISWPHVVTFAIGQWLILLATAAVLNAWMSARALGAGMFVLVIAFVGFTSSPLAIMDLLATWCFRLLPTGWLNQLLSSNLGHQDSLGFWILIPVGIWCGLGLWSWLQSVASYRIEEFLISSGSPPQAVTRARQGVIQNPAADYFELREANVIGSVNNDTPDRSLETLAAQVRSREFLVPQDWSKLGWIERFVDRWLTSRERVVVEFLSSEKIEWTQTWLVGTIQIPLLLCAYWVMQNGLTALLFSLPIPFLVVIYSTYHAFRCRSCGGAYLAQLSLFPVDRDEVVASLMKVAAMRAFAAMCFILLPAAIATMQLPFWPMVSLPLVLGCGVGLLLVQRAAIDFAFGLGACFSSWHGRNFRRRVLLDALPLLAAITMYVCATCSLVAFNLPMVGQDPIIQTVIASCAIVSVVCCISYFWLTRKYYLDGTFDLVRIRPTRWDQHIEVYEQALIQRSRATKQKRKFGIFSRWQRDVPGTEST